MIFFDTETCGFHGPVVLIQWAKDEEAVQLHSVFTSPICDTLDVVDQIISDAVVGFNLVYDMFHLNKLYNTLMFLGKEVGFGEYPVDYIDAMATIEKEARDGFCLKPAGALDLFLAARKTEYQTCMDRGDINIRRIPSTLARPLIEKLNEIIELPDILFARFADKSRRWEISPITNNLGEVNEELCNIYLRFAPSTALKAIIADAVLSDDIITFKDLDNLPNPTELGYAPYATSDGANAKNWKGRWPDVVKYHISHWAYNPQARKYAEDDVIYTRKLYEFLGKPPLNDDDSILACSVAAVRWKGLRVDLDEIERLKGEVQNKLDALQFNFNSPKTCSHYIGELLTEAERVVLYKGEGISTAGPILEELANRKIQVVCSDCNGMGCDLCKQIGLRNTDEEHPVAERARFLLDARHAQKEVELYDKLLLADRFHPSYKIIGALSGRMSGSDGLNPQGIKRDKRIRKAFPLAWSNLTLCGGDFDSFEVSIADAAWPDPRIHELLLAGKKFHGIFGVYLFPGHTYDEIVATQEMDGMANLYARAKQGVFAMLYGGDENTLANRVGIDESAAVAAYRSFCEDFPDLARARQEIAGQVTCLQQPNGIGTKVEWVEPRDYVESLLGFRRYYTLENQLCRALYNLASNIPKEWRQVRQSVIRRDREQTVSGATSSALYGAAFAITSASARSAGNHVIQSTGATITKNLQANLWALQPVGVHPWMVMPVNFHDEIMAPMVPRVAEEARKIVEDTIEKYKEIVPLIGMEWKAGMKTWADK